MSGRAWPRSSASRNASCSTAPLDEDARRGVIRLRTSTAPKNSSSSIRIAAWVLCREHAAAAARDSGVAAAAATTSSATSASALGIARVARREAQADRNGPKFSKSLQRSLECIRIVPLAELALDELDEVRVNEQVRLVEFADDKVLFLVQ